MIKVTERNSLILTNISFGRNSVHTVTNINEKAIALCRNNGIEIYNKKYKKKFNFISKPKESHKFSVFARPIDGISKDKYLLWRDYYTLSIVDLEKKIMIPFSNIKFKYSPVSKEHII